MALTVSSTINEIITQLSGFSSNCHRTVTLPFEVNLTAFESRLRRTSLGQLVYQAKSTQIMHLLDPETVAKHARRVRLETADKADLELLRLSRAGQRVERSFHHFSNGERSAFKRDRAVLQARDVENVVDESQQVFAARLDGL